MNASMSFMCGRMSSYMCIGCRIDNGFSGIVCRNLHERVGTCMCGWVGKCL